MVEQVRRFNRTVTQRVGALDDAFLSRDRPLGQARLLWEIGPDGSDVKALRARLDLDSGYLSRLLRSLEDAALVTVGEQVRPSPGRPAAEELIERYLADEQATAAELDISLPARELVLRPGGHGEVAVRLANGTAAGLRGEAQLVSPFGSWGQARPWTQGFAVGPGQDVTLRYSVTAAASARHGQASWVLVKVMYFGRVRYTETIACSVTDGPLGERLDVPVSTSERR